MDQEHGGQLPNKCTYKWQRVSCFLLCACLFALLIMAITKREAKENPWSRQAVHLKNSFGLFIAYRKKHEKEWPSNVGDLRTISKETKLRELTPFIDPNTNNVLDWLVFRPEETAISEDHGHLIAAAPIKGGYDPVKHKEARMVMFEDGMVTWIPEVSFVEAFVNK